MKEAIISTSRLNSYGSRVLTAGIDYTQYAKNPILLWMHRRPFEAADHLPIGRMENLRLDGDALIGTPVFDQTDEFAMKIARKWEAGFLKMVSAGLEVVETTTEAEHLVEGQTRPTISRSRLLEVSIVDIGANDDALQLFTPAGTVLNLAAGMDSDVLPLLNTNSEYSAYSENSDNNMNTEILTALGLAEDASEQDVLQAVQDLQAQVATLSGYKEEAETLRLSNLNALIDAAVREKRVSEGQRQTLLLIGQKAGAEALRETLSLLQPTKRPSDVINLSSGDLTGGQQTYEKLKDIPAKDLAQFKAENPKEYAALYKKEYGVEMPAED